MTVICPSCDARFRDPPIDLPKSNPLQCSKCEHEWVPAQLASPRLQLDAPSMAPEMADLVGDKNEIRTTLPVTISKPQESPKREPVYVDRIPASPQKRAGMRAWHWGGICLPCTICGQHHFQTNSYGDAPAYSTILSGCGTYNSQSRVADRQGHNNEVIKGWNPPINRSWRNPKHRYCDSSSTSNQADNAWGEPIKLICLDGHSHQRYA